MCHLCAYSTVVWALVFISELAFLRAVLVSTPTVFSSFIALHFMFKSSTHFVLVCTWRQGLASFFCVVWAPFIEENVAFPVVFLEPWLKRGHKCTIFHLFSWSVWLSSRTTFLLLWFCGVFGDQVAKMPTALFPLLSLLWWLNVFWETVS